MICRYCGTQLPDSAKFCAACGSSLSDEQPVTGLSASEAPRQKKRRFLHTAAAGGAVIAVGVCAAMVLANFAGTKKFFMGEERYARSVFMDALGGLAEDASAVVEHIDLVGGDIAAAERYDGAEAVLAALAMLNSSLGTDGLTVTAGVDVRPSEEVYSGLSDLVDELGIGDAAIRSLVQKLNGCSAEFTEKTSRDAYEFAASFGEGKDPLFNATLYYGADGDTYIAFPDASKGAFLAELDELPVLPEKKEEQQVDYKQLSDTMKQLEEVFDYYYDDAEVSVEKEVFKLSGASFNGLCCEIVFEADDMHDMLDEMIEVLDDSDYLCDLLEERFDGLDYKSDIIDGMYDFIDGMDESDVEFAFRGYVTPVNKLVGIELLMYDADNELRIGAMDTSEHFAVGMTVDTENNRNAEMFLAVEKTGSDSGIGVFELTDTTDRHFEFDFDYSDIGTRKVFGRKVPTGKLRLIFDEELVDSLSNRDDASIYLGDESFALDEILSSTVLTLSLSPDSRGLRCDFSFECTQLGCYGAYISVKPSSGRVASGKFKENRIVDIDDIAEEDGIALAEQIAFHYADELLKDELLAEVLEAAGLDDSDDLIEHFTGGYDIDEYIGMRFGNYAAHTAMTHPMWS